MEDVMKKLALIISTFMMVCASNASVAGPQETHLVFTGKLSVGRDIAILEHVGGNKKDNIKPNKVSQEDLSISWGEVNKADAQTILTNCNDGQVCKINAVVRRDKDVAGEADTYWLVKVKKIDVISK